MTIISIDKTLFGDFVSITLRRLSEAIQSICVKWHYVSGNSLLEDARSGKLEEAEMDAIELYQLLHDHEFLLKNKEIPGQSMTTS
jgi:hypothetical protein